jgi:SMC interacting uncharacterized protein involved in chromosome segregation
MSAMGRTRDLEADKKQLKATIDLLSQPQPKVDISAEVLRETDSKEKELLQKLNQIRQEHDALRKDHARLEAECHRLDESENKYALQRYMDTHQPDCGHVRVTDSCACS